MHFSIYHETCSAILCVVTSKNFSMKKPICEKGVSCSDWKGNILHAAIFVHGSEKCEAVPVKVTGSFFIIFGIYRPMTELEIPARSLC